jgi:hypothetical protein
LIMAAAAGIASAKPLVLLHSQEAHVTAGFPPATRPGSADTAWMPLPRRWYDMDTASTPYEAAAGPYHQSRQRVRAQEHHGQRRPAPMGVPTDPGAL